ncbi:MAG: HsdM family class I SAM-dependent methyltransferase, partial [Terriglobia bacterium]
MAQPVQALQATLPICIEFAAGKAIVRTLAEQRDTEAGRIAFARAFCHSLVCAYWQSIASGYGSWCQVRCVPVTLPRLTKSEAFLARDLAELLSGMKPLEVGYRVGTIYTAALPPQTRSALGAFYTPPALANRLLDLIEAGGFSWLSGSVIDPACGGGAFLAPVALRMLSCADRNSADILESLCHRLVGQEVDAFAAWLAQIFLDIVLLPLCAPARQTLPQIVQVVDSLKTKPDRSFDLVVGNPPYGRLRLDQKMRNAYARSLYGHANLYGLFVDLALRLVANQGVVAYVTPTSFFGGQYFKALRSLIQEEA